MIHWIRTAYDQVGPIVGIFTVVSAYRWGYRRGHKKGFHEGYAQMRAKLAACALRHPANAYVQSVYERATRQ